MAQIKNITIGQRVVQAGRRRKCYHNKTHLISKGDTCLEVRNGMGWNGYCSECGLAMVEASVQQLIEIKRRLVSGDENCGDEVEHAG